MFRSLRSLRTVVLATAITTLAACDDVDELEDPPPSLSDQIGDATARTGTSEGGG